MLRHDEALLRARAGDQLDNDLIGRQRLAHQFWVMKTNSRCSTRFHLLVPGGRCATVIDTPVAWASLCSPVFHSRTRNPVAAAAVGGDLSEKKLERFEAGLDGKRINHPARLIRPANQFLPHKLRFDCTGSDSYWTRYGWRRPVFVGPPMYYARPWVMVVGLPYVVGPVWIPPHHRGPYLTPGHWR